MMLALSIGRSPQRHHWSSDFPQSFQFSAWIAASRSARSRSRWRTARPCAGASTRRRRSSGHGRPTSRRRTIPDGDRSVHLSGRCPSTRRRASREPRDGTHAAGVEDDVRERSAAFRPRPGARCAVRLVDRNQSPTPAARQLRPRLAAYRFTLISRWNRPFPSPSLRVGQFDALDRHECVCMLRERGGVANIAPSHAIEDGRVPMIEGIA